ncbi:hypothetical protein QC815_16695 [Halomonas gomseomensis]|uniref:Uncharacterized protein n=1 Tax=Vreelandella gomseomensis TaxID=370766 RepID=A0ABU1GGE5_9GAMM|nr:hypothetical protein [Halomonas gomseomensis]MDR5876550.1 hypothetical protein [Halomonas gomseomensis]
MHIMRFDHFRLVVVVVADQEQRAARQALHPLDPALVVQQLVNFINKP